MNKTKLLTLSVILLIALNFGILGFIVFSKPEAQTFEMQHFSKSGPKEVIIRELNFDEEQKISYQKLIDAHRFQISTIEYKIRNSKDELYLLLKDEKEDASSKTALIDSLAYFQKQIEVTHFKHFQDIRKLCKKEQLKNFNALTEKLSKLFSKGPKPRHDE